jgi:hypothetical protein
MRLQRLVIAALLASLIGSPAHAGPADEARAALALALAGRAGDTPAPSDANDYASLHQRSIREGRPLLVWVGVVRPDLERAFPDCLHLRRDAFPDARPPCVVVGRPRGGNLWRVADLPAASASRERIAELLRDPPAAAPPPASRCGPYGCR